MDRATSLLLGATLLVGGCSQCPRGDTATQEPAGQEAAAAATAAEAARADSLARVRAATDEVKRVLGQVVQFDFDRSAIRPGSDTETLQRKAAILQANPGLTIAITGHCDQRGSDSYNMALGERRARAALQFLTGRGIAGNRITVRSMGEQQPIDPGQNEAAWAKNRRTEFAITGGGDVLRMP